MYVFCVVMADQQRSECSQRLIYTIPVCTRVPPPLPPSPPVLPPPRTKPHRVRFPYFDPPLLGIAPVTVHPCISQGEAPESLACANQPAPFSYRARLLARES